MKKRGGGGEKREAGKRRGEIEAERGMEKLGGGGREGRGIKEGTKRD